jgi:microcystin-dependent protein
MSDPFLAEVRIVGFNFPPSGWAECNGQLMPLSQNTALFALLGTMYGGDGKSTFALPDMKGNACVHHGQGVGLSQRFIGEIGGAETVTLLTSEIPVHTHAMNAQATPSSTGTPSANVTLARSAGGSAYRAAGGPTGTMAPQELAPQGGSLPHNNLMPYLVMRYIICLQGVFPARP